MSRETDLAWAAGFIDGEGFIGTRRHCYTSKRNGERRDRFSVVMAVSQKRIEPLNKLKDLFGGTIGIKYNDKSKAVSFYEWRTNSKNAVKVLRLLLPYLILKNLEAELILNEFVSQISIVGGKHTIEEIKLREEFHFKLIRVRREASLNA